MFQLFVMRIWPPQNLVTVAKSCGDHIQIWKVLTLIFEKNQRGNWQEGTTEFGDFYMTKAEFSVYSLIRISICSHNKKLK